MTRTTLFLCGDVMTGRGIDQILPHPSPPWIPEACANDAREYIELAEAMSGPVPRSVAYSYIWGEALEEFAEAAPEAKIINLETSITREEEYWVGKDVHYRMHPENVPCLSAAKVDVCVLANNHVLDYGESGLLETMDTLSEAGLRTAGAGRNIEEARRAAVVELTQGRLIVLGLGAADSGIPASWAATDDRPGVAWLGDLTGPLARDTRERVRRVKAPGTTVVASIHWGANWGYEVPPEHVSFAHALIDAGADIVHGHSSHHVRPIEIYNGRLILYGCGNFIDDYEGIAGYEEFRGDLAPMYFVTVDPATGELLDLRVTPMQMRNFRSRRASRTDTEYLMSVLNRIGQPFRSRVELSTETGGLHLLKKPSLSYF